MPDIGRSMCCPLECELRLCRDPLSLLPPLPCPPRPSPCLLRPGLRDRWRPGGGLSHLCNTHTHIRYVSIKLCTFATSGETNIYTHTHTHIHTHTHREREREIARARERERERGREGGREGEKDQLPPSARAFAASVPPAHKKTKISHKSVLQDICCMKALESTFENVRLC